MTRRRTVLEHGSALSWLVWALFLFAVSSGCGVEGTGPTSQTARIADLRIVSGNNQQGRPGDLLERPLVVRALDADGRSLSGVDVRFALTVGGGYVTDTLSVTGLDGTATTGLVLGPAAVIHRVEARIPELQGRVPTFTALVAASPGEVSVDDPADVPTLSGIPDTLLVALQDSVLAADGVSGTAVLATVLDDRGNAVSGATVRFTTTAGSVELAAITNEGGRADVTYRSPVNETASLDVVLTASVGSMSVSRSLVLHGVDLFLAASLDTIALDANSRAVLEATVTRKDGLPVAYAPVRFESSLGSLSAAEAQTDGNGIARSILSADGRAGEARVLVTYGAGITRRTFVSIIGGAPASVVVIDADPASVHIQGSGGNETAHIVFEVRDSQGQPVPDGQTVLFRLDAPGPGGEAIHPARTATVAGRVVAALSSGTVAHTVRVIAEVPVEGDTVRSTPVPIAVHGGLPDQAHFSLAARPVNVAGRVLYGLESSIEAFVYDQNSNPVPPNTSVRFRTDGGGVQGSALTDPDGRARVTLFAAAPAPPGPSYLATVTGQTVDAAGSEIEAQVTVLFSGPTAPIALTGAGADTILAGSLSVPEGGFQIIPFRVGDIDGNPLMGGSTILVSSDVAQVTGDATVTIPDARSGHVDYAITVADPAPQEDPPTPPQRGTVVIDVLSPNGNRQLVFSLTVD